jgi:uncharacterized protein with von Willebrand factor type A (vWA) domain
VIVGNVIAFGRLLRQAGLDVHQGRILDLVEALTHLDLSVPEDVRAACRALLVHRPEDLAAFDRLFDAFWRQNRLGVPPREAPRQRSADRSPEDAASASTARAPAATTLEDTTRAHADGIAEVRGWSRLDRLSTKDFDTFTDDEVALAKAALTHLEWNPGQRRTRRWVRGPGHQIDLRRALAGSLRTGGDVVSLPRRVRRTRPRPVVLVCDVSGSMERYSRMLLQFAHAFGRRHRHVEAFVFSTRLSRITAAICGATIDRAVAAASRTVPDWAGGTRIGDALTALGRHPARRTLRRRPLVLLVSDGWDRGDPDVLRAAMARLQRRAHRLIWLNPLLGSADYAPLTRGLKAALPYVDDFLPVRTLGNVAELAVHLNTLARRPRPHRRWN